MDFGWVRILEGDHKGEVGYYDDDNGDMALVYLGEPFKSEYVWLPFEHIGPLEN